MAVPAYEGVVENGCVKLPAGVTLPEGAKVYVIVPDREVPRPVHIYSPHLVNPEKAADFLKLEVIPESPDAGK